MKAWTILGFVAGVMCLSSCSDANVRSLEEPLVASDDVPDSLAARARLIAEDQSVFREGNRRNRVVYIWTDFERRKTDGGEEPPEDLYRVIHYRYDDDTAIHTVVNLGDGEVVYRKEIPHLPTPFTQQELNHAHGLAMNNATVREALGRYVNKVVVEGLPIHSASDNDPWFGRRVVQLLFKVGQDYISSPRVIVDLTNSNVVVEENGDTQ